MTPELPEHALVNRAAWTRKNAEYTAARAPVAWAEEAVTWGVWSVPESQVRVLPDVRGVDVIELGCGTAYFGAWLKRAGARRVVGVDVTPAQLATARALSAESGLEIELIEANAEAVPLPDAAFDLAVSEYGASIWCDPDLWIPEASRLLRVGGELVFLRNSTLSILCMPDSGPVGERLHRPQSGIDRIAWTDDDAGVEFHPATGDMLRIVRRSGFELVDLREVFAPEGAQDHPRYDTVPARWAQRWPSEEIWRLRKVANP